MNVQNTTLRRAYDIREFDDAIATSGPRSDGVLTPMELQRCREGGVPLAFDPVQIGWVPLSRTDDIAARAAADEEVEGFHFRAWEDNDAAALARMLSDELLWSFLPEGYPGPIDADTARDLIGLSHAPHHRVMAVIENGRPIGQVRLLFGSPDAAEISYWLGREHWGRRLGSRIVRRFTQDCLAERGDLERIFARVHEDNRASRRILEKAGYRLAGKDGPWETLDVRG